MTDLAIIDVEEHNKFEERRKALLDLLHQAKNVSTPDDVLKSQKGTGYNYADFSYMLELMDTYHPRRKETADIVMIELISQLAVIPVKVVIEDLETGEIRTGFDAHRITFQKDKERNLSAVVDIGNDIKSAHQEATRKAYSNFGVCADLYKRVQSKKPTEEQLNQFDELVKTVNVIITEHSQDPSRIDKVEPLKAWLNQFKTAWKKQTSTTADKWLENFNQLTQQLLKKVHDGR